MCSPFFPYPIRNTVQFFILLNTSYITLLSVLRVFHVRLVHVPIIAGRVDWPFSDFESAALGRANRNDVTELQC